tara:strand:- start:7583 stop:8932 length:1350 start_codon:yes stop_codon:yes gene_type:complete
MKHSNIKKIYVSKILTDKEISSKEGEHFDSKHFKMILNENADVYIKETGKLLLKFRKDCISLTSRLKAVDSLRSASKKKHENRGASAGALDRNKLAKYIGTLIDPGKFRTKFISGSSGKMSKQLTSNLSPSNIIGYYDRADRNLKGKGAPCRLTAFNRDFPEKFTNTLPFIQECNNMLKRLVPESYNKQYIKCQAVPEFAIKDTAFTTLTINYSWRTALHRDSGDFKEGFGNLIVLEDPENKNHYTGCYTGFPQYGVAVNIRDGDFLAMNVHEWHCNTEFTPIHNKIYGKWKDVEKLNNWYFNRLSVVCYLRDNMIRCKNLQNENKIQLLNKKSKHKNLVYNNLRNVKKPHSSEDFINMCILFKKKLDYHMGIFSKYKKDLIYTAAELNNFNTFIQNCFSYIIYYMRDFKNIPPTYLKFFKKFHAKLNMKKYKKFLNTDSEQILQLYTN